MIDFKELRGIQREFDSRVEYRKTDRVDFLFDALFIENAEAWNETKDFKFWSTKFKAPDREKLLDEFADILAFSLSIANHIELKIPSNIIPRENYASTKFFGWKSAFDIGTMKEMYELRDFGRLQYIFNRYIERIVFWMYSYGFKDEEIVAAYKKKMGVNHERQETGY